MHVEYAAQLDAKAEALATVLAPLDLSAPVEIEPSPKITRWRNRTNFVVKRPHKGPVQLGSRAPRSNDFAAMDGCLAIRPPMARLAERVAGLLKPARGLRYVSLRVNREGDALVELIARDLNADWVPSVADSLLRLEPVIGVAASENDSGGNAIRVNPARTLVGESTLSERFSDTPAYVTADAFLQLNLEVAEGIYGVIGGWAAEACPSRIVDLYCGVGPLGLSAAQAVGDGVQLVGVEVHAGSKALAQRAATEVGVNARFVTAALDDGAAMEFLEDAGVITVNPPRRGIDRPVRAALCELSEDRVLAYMSCSPSTFVRDVVELTEGGWRLTDLSAWDMLPNTSHVELLGRLVR
jgi:tRNA/tmRNA/rRNA uracil-C5-methylase (TrmA/RlmC/RlmD family)